MQKGVIAGVLSATGCLAATPPPAAIDTRSVEREAAAELDDLHAAAAAADESRYFAHFAADGVFLGTDAKERWDVPAFRAYAHPYFARGEGWKYVPQRRSLSVSPGGEIVWFDEDLKNAKLGLARGSGVMVRHKDRLLVVQYNLTVPVPNERMAEVVDLVRRGSPPPPTLDSVYRRAYEAATASAASDPLEDAAKALLEALPESKRHPEADTEFWLHDELAWVLWARGALASALAEVNAAGVALEHGTLPDAKRATLRSRELWDRAYLTLEQVPQSPVHERARALDAAYVAKTAFDSQATGARGTDAAAVLDAFFLTAAGKGKEAAEAARHVDIEKDEDLQDLYVVARAFDVNGDHVAADALVARICAGHTHLMKPLILMRLARDGRRCP